MPAVTLQGHLSKGHGGNPPRPSVEGCPRVTVGGVPVHCEGHAWAEHSFGGQTHGGYLSSGAPHVTIAGRGVGRVGDPISCGDTVAQGCPRVTIGDCGGPGFGREAIFNALTDPKDKLILCLPEMANAEAERANARDRQGWVYLSDFATKWMNSKAYIMRDGVDGEGNYDNGGQEPGWVDWDWLMEYRRFQVAVSELTIARYLFSEAARNKLVTILTRDGHFRQGGGPFNHALLDWQKWRSHAFQSTSIEDNTLRGLIIGQEIALPDGLLAALGAITIYALASGNATESGGRKTLSVTKVHAFIFDGFDFNGNQPLGNWQCSEYQKGFAEHDAFQEYVADKMGNPITLPSRLGNEDFRSFRGRTGYGCDFRVISGPALAWSGEFRYAM